MGCAGPEQLGQESEEGPGALPTSQQPDQHWGRAWGPERSQVQHAGAGSEPVTTEAPQGKLHTLAWMPTEGRRGLPTELHTKFGIRPRTRGQGSQPPSWACAWGRHLVSLQGPGAPGCWLFSPCWPLEAVWGSHSPLPEPQYPPATVGGVPAPHGFSEGGCPRGPTGHLSSQPRAAGDLESQASSSRRQWVLPEARAFSGGLGSWRPLCAGPEVGPHPWTLLSRGTGIQKGSVGAWGGVSWNPGSCSQRLIRENVAKGREGGIGRSEGVMGILASSAGFGLSGPRAPPLSAGIWSWCLSRWSWRG